MKPLLNILLLLLPVAAFAQTEKSGHTFRILFFDPPAGAPDTLYLYDGKEAREVELPRMNFSPVYELPEGPLKLSLLPERPVNPGEIPMGAPCATVPESVVDFYLLVTSDETNKVAPVAMHVVNAGGLRAGQMLWFNLSKKTIGGTVGSERLLIQPGQHMLLKAPAKANGSYPVSLAFRIPDDPNHYPLTETYWRYDSQSRSVVFIHSHANGRTPRVEGFADYRPPPETAQATPPSSDSP